MRKPEEITKDIQSLTIELERSKLFYENAFICDDKCRDDMIGFFNIGNAKKILTALYDGHIIQFTDNIYGSVNVYLNPQKNVLCLSDNKNINRDNIFEYIIWGSGSWYKIS